MHTFRRLVRTTLHRIVRSPNQALGAIFIMFLTFFEGGAIVLVTVGSQLILNYYESQPAVIAFLKDEATTNQVEELKALLESTGQVKDIKYVSKDEAFQDYQEKSKDNPALITGVTAAILPASLRVSSVSIDQLPVFKDILSKEQVVDDVLYPQEIIQPLASFTQNIRTFGGASVLFLLITSTIITLIVISLNISTYKDEIEIMRLVGATSSYIRTPFIMEGIFFGFVSALLATLGIWGLIMYLTPYVSSFFEGIHLLPAPLWVIGLILLGEIIVGVFIGTLAAFLATRKYLKI